MTLSLLARSAVVLVITSACGSTVTNDDGGSPDASDAASDVWDPFADVTTSDAYDDTVDDYIFCCPRPP